jgi:predicted aldo/keto reductase-like oxidoreductase
MKQLFNNDLEKQNIDYGDFEIINVIKQSKYFKGLKMISKNSFTYVDHNFILFKNKTIQNTYVIILSNDDISINLLLNYDFYTYF